MTELLGEWHLKPQLEEARRVREELATLLEQSECKNKDAFLLATAELIVNLSRYPDPKPSEVVLTLTRDQSDYWLELRDNGPSFSQFSQMLDDPEDLTAAESGMGLKLLAHYFDDMHYVPACYRDDACNVMVLRQARPQAKSALTVLVVDDDPAYRMVIEQYLQSQYKVLSAESVSEAFQKVLKYKPDLVVCDIHMPQADGPALFDKISHIPEVADTAFIYVTGCIEPEILNKALRRPIDDLLSKPVTREQLLTTIQRVVFRREHLSAQIHQEVDQKVTLGLRPSLPKHVPGYEIELRTVNPEAGGGDLVQFYPQKDRSLFLFADLMGHGLSAKGFSYALAGYLRGLCSAHSSMGIELPALFNQLALGFDEDPVLKETLATIAAMTLSPEGDVAIINAGHPSPILFSDTEVKDIEAKSPMLGMGIEGYQQACFSLEINDRVLLYSDGFNDAAVEMPKELKAAIERSRHLTLAAAADHLLQVRLNLSAPDDDLTLILLERTES